MASSNWSASQYMKFEDERTRPARDLLAQVPLGAPKRIADLGCGPGNSTELIAARWPEAELIGIDSAPDMLDAARRRLPGRRFVEADLSTWMPDGTFDLLFANAVFQWVPDHLAVLRRLFSSLPAGGVLAVQMPDNLAEPTHLLMEKVARSPAFAGSFSGIDVRRPGLPAPRDYFDALLPDAAHLEVWHTIYNHPLADAAAIVEWVKGTGLRPYLAALTDPARADYIESYRLAIAEAYPPMTDGRVLLRFPRLFLVAIRA